VTNVAPAGAETLISRDVLATRTALLGGEVTAKTAAGAPLVYACDLALPNADTFTMALPAFNPETVTCATPALLVFADATLKPRISGSVTAKETSTPDSDIPEKSLTVALSVEVAPPTINEVLPTLFKAMLAPTTLI
jgi:hypothetical protein